LLKVLHLKLKYAVTAKTFGKLFIDIKLNIFYLYSPEGGTILLKCGVC